MKVEKDMFVTDGAPAGRGSKRSRVFTILVCVIFLMIGFYGGYRYGAYARTGTLDPSSLDYSTLDDLYNQIKSNYDGNISTSDLIAGAKKGLVSGLNDPYSEYFTASEASDYLNDINGSINGVGVELMVKNSALTIVTVLDDSPAKAAGLRPGDVIAEVDGASTSGWTADSAVSKIRGDKGTTVKLGIVRGTDSFEKTLTRAEITDPSVTWSVKDGNIGYIKIARFAESDTADLIKKAANDLKSKNVAGIVLDLRDNGGGYVDAAQAVAEQWLSAGAKIVDEKNATTTLDSLSADSSAGTLKGIKTIVLVDGYTASAAEIVSGALRDNGAATLLGEKTYGKGVVQTMKTLADGGTLKLTVAKWYTPKGTNINHDGLEPDTKVVFDSKSYDKTGADNQLDKALALLKS